MTPAAALQAVLAVLEEDQLAAYMGLVDLLAGLVVECRVDGDAFHVVGGGRLDVVSGAPLAAQVHVTTSKRAIVALIDGEITVLQAVKAGQLDVLADTALLVRIGRAQRVFADGAARAARIRPVLAGFRKDRRRRHDSV